MSLKTRILQTGLTLLMGVAFVQTSLAETDVPNETAVADEEQPVHITANALDIQDQKGISVYKGDVEVNQGSLTLMGDRVTIKHPDRALKTILTKGQPAKFKRFDAVEQAWVHGQADTIYYHAKNRTVQLTGQARVEQPGKHVITGPKLFYDLNNKTLRAESTPKEKERISVTLIPEKAEEPSTKPMAEPTTDNANPDSQGEE